MVILMMIGVKNLRKKDSHSYQLNFSKKHEKLKKKKEGLNEILPIEVRR